MLLPHIVNFAAAVTSLVAGGLWWKASRVKYPEAHILPGGVVGGYSRKDDLVLAGALRESGRLNAWAALVSCAAAMLVALGLFIGSI